MITAEHFKGWANIDGIDLVEDEYGDKIYAYGHLDPQAFIDAVNKFYEKESGPAWVEGDRLPASDVIHIWAYTVVDQGPDSEWQFNLLNIQQKDSFPITMVRF